MHTQEYMLKQWSSGAQTFSAKDHITLEATTALINATAAALQ